MSSSKSAAGLDDPARTHQALAPVCDHRTRVLILGSLPGSASLASGQYYAHRRNGFWKLLGAVIHRELDTLPYVDRLEVLSRARIGLWDVISSAKREGSLDSAIRSPETADLNGLVGQLPHLRAVAFNGSLAARLGQTVLAPNADRLELIVLPSSSPAHARPFTEKAAAWARLKPLLV